MVVLPLARGVSVTCLMFPVSVTGPENKFLEISLPGQLSYAKMETLAGRGNQTGEDISQVLGRTINNLMMLETRKCNSHTPFPEHALHSRSIPEAGSAVAVFPECTLC